MKHSPEPSDPLSESALTRFLRNQVHMGSTPEDGYFAQACSAAEEGNKEEAASLCRLILTQNPQHSGASELLDLLS